VKAAIKWDIPKLDVAPKGVAKRVSIPSGSKGKGKQEPQILSKWSQICTLYGLMDLMDVQMCGMLILPQTFMSVKIVRILLHITRVKNQTIRNFRNNMVEGVGKGDILAEVEYRGNPTRICLTEVMHIPGADRNILSLKALDQKRFESRIVGDCVQIMKNGKIYTEARVI